MNDSVRPPATAWPRHLGVRGDRNEGPTVVVFGGMHGNEPAGLVALQEVLAHIDETRLRLRGRFVALSGNLPALAVDQRFVDRDLNRRWFREDVERLRREGPGEAVEDREQHELLGVLDALDAEVSEPLYVLDLHSFSADGPPFSCASDTLRNRPLSFALGVPLIVGLEEAVQGTMLGYLSDLGHVAVAFEGGTHADPQTRRNHVAAVWSALAEAGLLAPEDVPDAWAMSARLRQSARGYPRAVEILHRHPVRDGDGFRMRPGWRSFMPVRAGEVVADDHRGPVACPMSGRMMMPLYQGQGEDGFFVARDLGTRRLGLSNLLRRVGADELLPYWPGVRWDEGADALRVREEPSAPLKEALRLFGYRRRRPDGSFARRRELATRRGRRRDP